MRGKPKDSFDQVVMDRITPAHAGKTRAECIQSRFRGDHPRACGENYAELIVAGLMTGSPPRMRGKHVREREQSGRIRITPAHAGKTYRAPLSFTSTEDHPRACGENPSPERLKMPLRGSPPRMRGKPGVDLFGVKDFRITPAHAGKTNL